MTPDRRPLLEALGTVLRAHKLAAEMTLDGLHVTNPMAEGCCPERPSTTIVTRRREDDCDRMWFLTADGLPLAEADNFPDVVTAVKSMVNAGQEIRRIVRREPGHPVSGDVELLEALAEALNAAGWGATLIRNDGPVRLRVAHPYVPALGETVSVMSHRSGPRFRSSTGEPMAPCSDLPGAVAYIERELGVLVRHKV
ncbi:hypothetical protein GCM10010191_26100 [Actinomadura vinacea]|uniref:Uncharacterized protein n=1 Tax=Actinomadura vinacea TaxID=115336 RepID=A0ABN3IUT3_9ACTN